MALAERYHEILKLRREGLKKYGVLQPSDPGGPPVRLSLPHVSRARPSTEYVRLGPMYFSENPPIWDFCVQELFLRKGGSQVLEIGPGKGTLALNLKEKLPGKIEKYFGYEQDRTVNGPYERIDRLPDDIKVDVLIASEVIEHMSADVFYDQLLSPIASQMSADAVAIFGTPNALSAGSIFRDFTHVQGYTWYDLYAILRTKFQTVDVFRTRYLWSPHRIVTLLPSIIGCRILELDWCDGLVCVARDPIGVVSTSALLP